MTVWAMAEAQNQGYHVSPEAFVDTVNWTKERLADIDKPRDSRPGWSMMNTPALYLAIMALTVPDQTAISKDELQRIAGHLERHQEIGGNWAWSSAPAQNRPPPVFESDEVATLLGSLAMGPHVQSGAKERSAAGDSRDKAAVWLAMNEPDEISTQAAAFRLLLNVQKKRPARNLRNEIGRFLSRQQEDGGWPQIKGARSDAYATGQALYVLSLAGIKSDSAEIQRGAAFLLANQREDGSWPMTSRAQPGATPFTNPSPITYFGSAWATIGLMRSAGK